MSKIVFADNSEVEVNDVSSVFAITLDTVDTDKVEEFKNKLTNKNLKSFRIVNENPNMCSEGKEFTFVEIARNDMNTGYIGDGMNVSVPEQTSTMFLCRPLNETEKAILSLAENDDAKSEAIMELAEMLASLM